MDSKELTREHKDFIEMLESTREVIGRKMESKGYVVAGNGGETYYAFVGEGNGYKGAALTPVSVNPVIFNSVKAAQREADNGTYRNGNNKVIALEVVPAADYFKNLHDRITRNIEQAVDLFKN